MHQERGRLHRMDLDHRPPPQRPSTSYTSLGLLRTDTKITVACYAKNGSWAHIKVRSGANSGKTGWISAYYISVPMQLD
ncbi:SH3 domain-containing protein [Streptomyces parvulus]|uniref:SH3 domain-containing protein n=1 Tax=Streptomyces parvulus TaxID=146923 RepID=UPI003796FE82